MREKKRRVSVIGHFGGGKTFLDGQTVKTEILFEELSAAADWELRKVDTYYKKRRPLLLIGQTARALFTTRDIFLLVSGNGMRFYIPLLAFFTRLRGIRVYHDAIGSNAAQLVKSRPRYVKYLNAFARNYVETELLRRELTASGVTNCETLPNFKRLPFEREPACEMHTPARFCTFSRVTLEKGIETAVDAVETINREAGETLCTLDIYGAVDDRYRDRFARVQSDMSDAVRYRGSVPYNKSSEILREYDALLFPTFWKGECFPGTVIDAFCAGLPVLASDWGSNAELIENGKTGFVYPNEKMRDLKEAIGFLLTHRECLYGMRKQCLSEGARYQPDAYISRMIRTVEEKKG